MNELSNFVSIYILISDTEQNKKKGERIFTLQEKRRRDDSESIGKRPMYIAKIQINL